MWEREIGGIHSMFPPIVLYVFVTSVHTLSLFTWHLNCCFLHNDEDTYIHFVVHTSLV